MSKIKIVILGIGIAIVLAFVIGFGVDTFYKSPEWEDFCGERTRFRDVYTKEECENNGGKWEPNRDIKPVTVENNQFLCSKGFQNEDGTFTLNCETKEALDREPGWCDVNYVCNNEFEEAEKPYAKNSFIIIIVLGLIAVIIGSYLKLTSVSAGIMGGGVLVMIYAAMRFWRNLDEYLRFTILVITLGILIWIGYKKFKK